ncbi:hypothetical protein BJV78DRAFT_1263092 [Lactifluus subvellereus]|nr:hypothetical protein BJV78DRAFT_1263092 [Lactifluus subvellereus]
MVMRLVQKGTRECILWIVMGLLLFDIRHLILSACARGGKVLNCTWAMIGLFNQIPWRVDITRTQLYGRQH